LLRLRLAIQPLSSERQTPAPVAVYSPAGELLGLITLPGVARNLAFGDKDLRTLYMIGNSLYRVRVAIPGSIQY
jgi:gluconolactonase